MKLYEGIATLLRPVAWWGRLRTEGLEAVPERGPVLVVPNHDSQWDPVLVGLALRRAGACASSRGRACGGSPAWARSSTAWARSAIRRGAGDAQALEQAVEALRSGEAVCVFPEGGLSWGRGCARTAASDAWLRRAQAQDRALRRARDDRLRTLSPPPARHA